MQTAQLDRAQFSFYPKLSAQSGQLHAARYSAARALGPKPLRLIPNRKWRYHEW